MDGMGIIRELDGNGGLDEIIERMLHLIKGNPTDTAIVSELPEPKIDDIKKLDNDKKIE